MLKYYLKDGTREKGPFMLDDLKYQRIRPDTLVRVDNGDWQPVSSVHDLRFLLKEGAVKGSSSNAFSSARSQHQVTDDASKAKRTAQIMIAISIALAVVGMGVAMFMFNSASK